MTMNGTEKMTVILLSLMFPITAYTDYYYRPTPRAHERQHNMRGASNENQSIDCANATAIPPRVDTRSTNGKPRQQAEDNPIVYPEHPKSTSCEYGLCTNVAGYPKEQIENLLSRSQFMNGYFEASEDSIVIDNRFNSDEMSLCETKVHTIYPEKANNTMKIEKVIVNVEGHKQGIVFETCVNNGKCKFSSHFPTGYTSYCKQKYIHKRLMVVGDNDKFVFDSFEVPSCCVCTITRTD